MKLLAAGLAIALASPAFGFERMSRAQCQDSFVAFSDLLVGVGAEVDLAVPVPRVTVDGWCQLDWRELVDERFDRLEWRMEGVEDLVREGIPPLALGVRIEGLEPDEMQGGVSTARPPLTLEATFRQVPDAGQLIVERAELSNSAGDVLAFSGVFERVFLSSEAMMQVSMGSAAFKTGIFEMILSGRHENPFGFDVDVEMRGNPQAQREAAFNLISKLPEGAVSDSSRAELTAFAGDLPRPKGGLEIAVVSERGLGFMQLGMSVYLSAERLLSEDGDSEALDILFDGLTIDVDWTPSDQVAD